MVCSFVFTYVLILKNINMKQLLSLFLLLLPCLAWAQYPSNGNQKITLGEQTTADGLIWRGISSDTTLTAKSDTAAYFVLDTANLNLYTYKASATGKKWIQLGSDTTSLNLVSRFATKLNISDTASMLNNYWRSGRFSGVLPVANGGTGSATQNFVDLTTTQNVSGLKTFASAVTVNGIVFNQSDDIINTQASITKHSVVGLSLRGTAATVFNFSLYSKDGTALFTNLNNTDNMNFNAGLVGFGFDNPSATVHIRQGSSSNPPLKFTSGTNLTTAEAGAMEFNGTNLFFSPSTTRHTVNHGLTGSATLNFPSTLTMLSADLTITVTGAADGDVVSLGVPNAAVNANTFYSAWVSAANTVTVRFNNYSIGTVDPASALFKVFVTK
jgi:hypothetical protein